MLSSFHILTRMSFKCILDILTHVRWNLRVVLICIFLMAKDVQHFLSVYGTLEYPLLRILYIDLYISPLSDMELAELFSHSMGSQFVQRMVSFALQKLFSFMRSHLIVVHLLVFTIGVLLRISPVPMRSRLFPTFTSIRFNVSGFMLRILIHFVLSFCAG